MKTYIGRLLLMGIALAVVSCAAPGVRIDQDTEVIHKTIAPKDIHEDCMKAMPGQKIVYAFEASMPVNFNIHFHKDGKVNYGVFEKGISLMNLSTYHVEVEQYYCLMWTNTNPLEVQLQYSSKVKD